MSEALSAEFVERARAWAAADPDPKTRADLERALAERDRAALISGFAEPLAFGTAGLRGQIGFGPARMNVALMVRLGSALSRLLVEDVLAGRGVVVGFDARPDSQRFARALASEIEQSGLHVWLAEVPVPTPVVAYHVRALGAGAGVVVTASHNPRDDAGCKVYDELGVQIVSPWDTRIAAFLGDFRPIRLAGGRAEALSEEHIQSYVDALVSAVEPLARGHFAPEPDALALRIAYSPLHGVGRDCLCRALDALGAEGGALGRPVALAVVPEQAAPDGTFPTLPEPNPELPGVLDRLLALARRIRADLAIANDPDADRLAAALPHPGGGHRVLTGDQLGLLLADHALRLRGGPGGVVVSTVVSSPGLDRIAALHGARVVRTLTGFKWLCRAAATEPDFTFAYEEALGYCFREAPGSFAPLDKDGIFAAVRLVELLAEVGSGERLWEHFVDLARRVGVWGTSARSVGTGGSLERTRALMARLRAAPPERLGQSPLASVVDYAEGARTRPSYLGAQDLLEWTASDGTRVLVRPSGTEPKVKFYAHGSTALPTGAPLARYDDAEQRVRTQLDSILAQLIERAAG